MPTILQTTLALLAAAPGAYNEVVALWNQAKTAFSASDQATVDRVLAALDPKLDADIAQLHNDAAA